MKDHNICITNINWITADLLFDDRRAQLFFVYCRIYILSILFYFRQRSYATIKQKVRRIQQYIAHVQLQTLLSTFIRQQQTLLLLSQLLQSENQYVNISAHHKILKYQIAFRAIYRIRDYALQLRRPLWCECIAITSIRSREIPSNYCNYICHFSR